MIPSTSSLGASVPVKREQPRRKETSTNESSWQQRTDHFPLDKAGEYKKYPMVTANQLRTRKERPRKVKMLMRDFIEDSLYNPSYGYFSKQAIIFTPGEPFDFTKLPDDAAFQTELGRRYTEFEDKLDEKEYDATRQVWHTPTELFRPYYGEAVARHLVSNYKLSLYPYHDLLIYEMGAGNGTLMLNILDYIRDADPEVYARTKFRVIEVSTALAALQSQQLQKTLNSRGHADKVTIINKSIFDWDEYVSSPVFFLAMEVFDNFGHDIIRYDHETEQPLQGVVLIDADGEFFEFETAEIDPVAARFLRVREAACAGRPFNYPLRGSRTLRRLKSSLPLAYNLSEPEYIPTRLMNFFDVLREYFPNHKLISSDFHALPDAIKGVNSPVVQTRYKRRMVPVRTPLVRESEMIVLKMKLVKMC